MRNVKARTLSLNVFSYENERFIRATRSSLSNGYIAERGQSFIRQTDIFFSIVQSMVRKLLAKLKT